MSQTQTAMKIWVVYAVEGERIEVCLPNAMVHYYPTGIGKVNAVLAVAAALRQAQELGENKPDLILNVGTAGSVSFPVGFIVVCTHYIDRDMAKLKDFGVPYQLDALPLPEQCSFFNHLDIAHTCNTGDTFVTEPIEHADVVDMEGFALAAWSRQESIPMISIKYITDQIGQNSIKHWQEKLSDARHALQTFFEQIK